MARGGSDVICFSTLVSSGSDKGEGAVKQKIADPVHYSICTESRSEESQAGHVEPGDRSVNFMRAVWYG